MENLKMCPSDVHRLAEMLQPASDPCDVEDRQDGRLPMFTRRHGPTDILAQAALQSTETTKLHISGGQKDQDDDRLVPEVRFVYSQKICPEDIFLKLGLRTAGSASCESLRVTLCMPEEEAGLADINVHVECARNCVELRSPRYRLSLPLPQPVDPCASLHLAQWDATRRELTVTVRLRRELDYTNF